MAGETILHTSYIYNIDIGQQTNLLLDSISFVLATLSVVVFLVVFTVVFT